MSNITVTHANSGLVVTQVLRTERVTPHMTRVTFSGGQLDRFRFQGFDQWFRLAIPVSEDSHFERMPQKFGMGGYLKYLTLPKGTRPVIRNYTVRDFRAATPGVPAEMDVDFLVHGTEGVAGPWAESAEPGAEVAFIDQGCGWKPVDAARTMIVADESGLPAALGVLRDMPRDAAGDAVIELFDERDRQDDSCAPEGVAVHWVIRGHDELPGTALLPVLQNLELTPDLYGFSVGESAVATGARRHLVSTVGVPKSNVTFCGYWKRGKSAPS
ncbi:MAG: siderophore-interacting protein [Micrococcaceae bacterium]